MQKGTCLNEYRLMYVTSGEGTLVDGRGKKEIAAGSVVIFRPGYRHACGPREGSAWTACSIAFNGGPLAARTDELFPADGPNVFRVGVNDELVHLIASANECAATNYGHTPLLFEATVCHILALVKFLSPRRDPSDEKMQEAIRYTKSYMAGNLSGKIDLQQLAAELGMSYSWFRRAFREHTGAAPAQYLQSLRIRLAKDLLLNTGETVKDISAKCGFTTPEYFCNVFREATGKSPVAFRESLGAL